jgi:hypothetical protein
MSDLFAFPKPGDPAKSILIMDVHPSFGIAPDGVTTTEPFAAEAMYELRIDTDGDYATDIAYRVRFSLDVGQNMTASLRRADGGEASGMGQAGLLILDGAPVSMGADAQISEAGEVRFFAGWRSDPFFMDVGVGPPVDDMHLTGQDLFADKDVCSITLEVPNRDLESAVGLHLWHRSLVQTDAAGIGWIQADRGALASQAVFLPGERRDAYLGGEPAQDAQFVDTFAHSLEQSGFYTFDEARRAARSILPDVLPYDHRRPAAYPSNGRALTDDVANVFLAILTNGNVYESGIGPHTDVLSDFPYLGPPHRTLPAGPVAT